jgi:hypothetical protein
VSPRRTGRGAGRAVVFVGFGLAFGVADVGATVGRADGLAVGPSDALAPGADAVTEGPTLPGGMPDSLPVFVRP